MEAKVATGERECSMCGDIGFSSELFQCTACISRWQHSYCSRLYPNMACSWGDNWVCDWCFGSLPRAAEKPKRSSSVGCSKKDVHRVHKGAEKAAKRKDKEEAPEKEKGRQEWDALDYLLEAAQLSASSDGETGCLMKRQACSSKRTCARKLSCVSSSTRFKRQQKQGFSSHNEVKLHNKALHRRASSDSKPLSLKSTSIRRYKLLSDVCKVE